LVDAGRRHAVFLRFVGVGVVSLVVDAGTLFVLYDIVGTRLWVATSAGFWLSFAVNFLANKYLTFEQRAGGGGQLARYAVLVLANYGANLGLVTLFVAVGLPAVVGKVLSTGLLTAVNFVVYRVWVFRD
jgi:putative flippase GtrA